MLTIAIVNSFDDLLQLKEQWNSVLGKSRTNTIFLTFEWITGWWKFFGSDKKLFIILVKENAEIRGIAPLMITPLTKFGITLNKLEFIGMPLSDYADFIISENDKLVLEKIYSCIIENNRLWSFMVLNRVPETSVTLAQSREFFKPKKLFHIYASDVCPIYTFDETWPSFKMHLRNKKMRKAIRFFKTGGLSLSRFQGDNESASKILSLFFDQHKEKWNQTPTASMFNNNTYEAFFKHIFAELLPKNQIALFYLIFNQKPIAFQYSFLYNNKYSIYSSTYDTTYSKQSPGKILHAYLLEYCALNHLSELDHLRGGEKYKFRYSNNTRKIYAIMKHRNILLYFIHNIYNVLESIIKNNEFLYNFFIKYEKKLRIF